MPLNGPIASALIGVWALRQFSNLTDGRPPLHPFGPTPEGRLIYTPDGFVSALLMAPGRPEFSGNGFTDGTPVEYELAGKGFIGYCRTYQVDEARSMVTHHPTVSFAPNMIGRPQERLVELNGGLLVLTAMVSVKAWNRLEWVRISAGEKETEER
jgi:hypothetical protein